MTHLIILTQYSLVDKFLVLFTPQDPLRERERENKQQCVSEGRNKLYRIVEEEE